jgi:hypothetical protein
MILAIWITTLVLLGLWSLAAWGLAGLFSIDGRWLADVEPWLARVPFGAVLEDWFPMWQFWAREAIEWLQLTLQWLGGAAPWLVGLIWLCGAFVLLLLAGALTLVVALVRKSMPPSAPAPAPQA